MNPGDQIGKYEILKSLGGGAFGEVYLARDRALDADKAIKILALNNPAEALHKLQEAQIQDRCRHKNIVQIDEANLIEINGAICVVLALELLPDGSIESELASRWFSVKESCQRVSEMLAGLQFAHSNGYLHRDIKPANILIDGAATKLSDFGLATGAPDCLGSTNGYLPHCPPEFYTTRSTNIQSDVFASGVTLFRIVNNITNWRDRLNRIHNWGEHVRRATLLKKIGFRNYVPTKIIKIINKACNADPSRRYASAAAFKADIDALRYEIEWRKDGDGHWVGKANDARYTFSVEKRRDGYEIRCKKNGRRVNQLSQLVKSAEEIDGSVDNVVALTTLR